MTNAQTTVNELELFDETIAAIGELKLMTHVSLEIAGEDFSLVVDRKLLNPSFYIVEVYGGEKLIEEITFDRHTQSFYIRKTGEHLTHEQLIQHISRSLIPWVVGVEFKLIDPAELSRLRTEIESMGYMEFSNTVADVAALIKAGVLLKLNHAVGLYNADTQADRDVVNAEFEVKYEDYIRQNNVLEARLNEFTKEFTVDRGFISKLMRLLGK